MKLSTRLLSHFLWSVVEGVTLVACSLAIFGGAIAGWWCIYELVAYLVTG